MKTCDILILGAGSVGVPLAYFCAQKGLSVIVVEKNTSWCRGQNKAAIGGIRATHSDPAKIAICKESINIVRALQEEQGIDIEWKAGGYLFVAYDAERETAFKNLLTIQHQAGLNINWIGPEQVNELVPGITMQGLRGGTYSPEDGYASPLMTGTAFYKLAKEAGAIFHFCETVIALKRQGSQITTVITDKEEYAAKLIVNAAGADAAELASLADLEIPVHPDCHEAGVTDPVERFMVPMLVDIRPDDKSGNYYFYQAETGQIVFCITPKPQIWGKDIDNTSGFLPHVLRRMVALYPRLANLKIRRTWRGLYPMTPDGLPIVGYAHELDNFLLLVGMCGQGFMLGPGLGKIMAEVITDSCKPEATKYRYIFEELSLYRRFEGMEMLK